MASIGGQLIPRRAQTLLPPPEGEDIDFACYDHEGILFYCKGDGSGRPVRATELICTRLADRLGIRTAPYCARSNIRVKPISGRNTKSHRQLGLPHMTC